MFDFFKKKKTQTSYGNNDEENNHNEEDSRREDKTSTKIAAGFSTAEAIKESTRSAAVKYAKPDNYTGNRKLYDSGAAKMNAKKEAFSNGSGTIKDPYTGKELVLTKKEAKALYGDDWQKHLAESDHNVSIKKVHSEAKKNPFATNDDIKEAVNSKENLTVTSRKFNNAKRDRSNKDFVNDDEYLKEKGVKLTKKGKEAAIEDEKVAQAAINRSLRKATVKNVINTGHEAGVQGAQNAGTTTLTMSGIKNIVSVIKGEKSAEEAVEDVVTDTGKAAASGYVVSNGMTVVSHALSYNASEFVKGLAQSDIPGKVITAVVVTGDTLKRYGNGEISTQECLIELGDKGLNLATTGYAMALGQSLIPIPIVGAAVGALVGSTLTSEYYNQLIDTLKTKELEHEERMRIIEECNIAAEQTRVFRKELEQYLEEYFSDYKNCFDDALSQMNFAYQTGDADGIISGANKITRKLGGQVHYENVEEFKSFLNDQSVDVL